METTINYLSQFREESPLWLREYKAGDHVPFSIFMSGRIGYYPGSYFDGNLIVVGNQSHTVHTFLHLDYHLRKKDLLQHIAKPANMHGYHVLGMVDWKENEVLPNGRRTPNVYIDPVKSHMFTLDDEPFYCTMVVFERDADKDDSWGSQRFAVTFLLADGIDMYYQLFVGEQHIAPWICLLQDHSFGCNYDRFGGKGLLGSIISLSGVRPRFVLLGKNTKIWEGFLPVEGVQPTRGGMHNMLRYLYVKNQE